jgi:predicted transposase YdaD
MFSLDELKQTQYFQDVREEARQEGREEGREEGIEQGIEQGRLELEVKQVRAIQKGR